MKIAESTPLFIIANIFAAALPTSAPPLMIVTRSRSPLRARTGGRDGVPPLILAKISSKTGSASSASLAAFRLASACFSFYFLGNVKERAIEKAFISLEHE